MPNRHVRKRTSVIVAAALLAADRMIIATTKISSVSPTIAALPVVYAR